MPAPRTGPRLPLRSSAVAFVLVVALAILGPEIVTDAFENPTGWTITKAVLWTLAAATYITEMVRSRRAPSQSKPCADAGPIDIDYARDAAHAVATTTTRIDAIKTLRGRNPGLGLRDAADLIDTALTAPDPPTI